jgi:thioredoxin reductase (NADPH)
MAQNDLRAVAFPKLDEADMAAVGRCASAQVNRYRDGQILFQIGERDFKFFIIKSGQIEIIDDSGETPKSLAVLGPGEFTGDVAHLTGRPSVVSAVARGDCEVYEISAEVLRQILNRSPQLGDIILHAFIARRQLLRDSESFTGLRVIGSRYSRDTFRIREFLSKNRVLFTWLDLETDPQVNQLLTQFGVTEGP